MFKDLKIMHRLGIGFGTLLILMISLSSPWTEASWPMPFVMPSGRKQTMLYNCHKRERRRSLPSPLFHPVFMLSALKMFTLESQRPL